MRTLLLAAVLFYSGYGFVAIGHNAGIFEAGKPVFEAIYRQARALGRQATGLLEQKPEPKIKDETAPVMEREATFSDYLETANRAFDAMDRSCSEADRMQLGRAFHDLVAYTRGLASRNPNDGAGAMPTDVPANLSEIEIYAQVIDATRRGVLRSRHFEPRRGKTAKQPAAQRQDTKQRPGRSAAIRASAGPTSQGIASAGRIRLTRCPPATP